ncbi:hypothetical protein T08_12133 [Trichinella sp. T8]|nr:hypothetical protein T08_12133 [Trichinella sp. T8]
MMRSSLCSQGSNRSGLCSNRRFRAGHRQLSRAPSRRTSTTTRLVLRQLRGASRPEAGVFGAALSSRKVKTTPAAAEDLQRRSHLLSPSEDLYGADHRISTVIDLGGAGRILMMDQRPYCGGGA